MSAQSAISAHLRRMARKLELARLTERYAKDEEFATFMDGLAIDVMEAQQALEPPGVADDPYLIG